LAVVNAEEALPPLFAKWMGALLAGPIAAEKTATCARCAMCRPVDAEDAPPDLFFSPATKCCTYLPELSNFLVGRILADDDPDAALGRASVEARMDAGAGVTPLGLQRTPLFSLLYRNSPESFGHAASMRCPHYLVDGGRCGVWRHRESTCATWFCKYVRGETGRSFWQRLHDVLSAAEEAVRTHCLIALGLDMRALASLHPSRADAHVASMGPSLGAKDVDRQVDPLRYQALWGSWRGKERELYARCAEMANALEWRDVLALGGVRLRLLADLLLEADAKVRDDRVPERPIRRRLTIVYTSHDTVEVVGYSSRDALRVPRRLMDSLHHFDGRATGEALAAIAEQHGLRVTPGAVRKLVDFGILSEKGEIP
jgi:hypothetical protein